MGDDQEDSSTESTVNITYETLFEMLRQEKNRAEVQKLSPEFLSDVSSYVKSKLDILATSSSDSGLFADEERSATEKQLLNIRRILKELYDRREKKIISIAVNKARTGSDLIDTSGMLNQESELFSSLVGTLMHFRGNLLSKLISGELASGKVIASNDSVPAPVPESENTVVEEPEADELPSEEPQDVAEEAPEPKKLKTDTKNDSVSVTVKFIHSVPKFAGLDLEVYGPFTEEDVVSLPKAIADVLMKKGHARSVEAAES
ncbi:hypothetical protein HN419_07875 [Candidatus Woesearchaeota archaeon]|jgi:DNA replication initiation complex subunit (GINS family)|nr:hypothetical protein [Candidatus Woesearchaeota archaeon]MBT3538407.1 hypothetical protein [Candidatus Woesearchaeota archaeon]MBT4698368.1 hypothetical protein [Candidatus Woesearchaeota archaeon]MBT4716400.1 hypothetical protein [Candidatus Woesearchaeota archaeon]MBT7106076.1 hypothetical protein [Candidatus Woesearchaeota archaeon]